ncbi:MAG: hypothetical protein K6F99_03680 [Lachnospiraceae bacterium]|nr:hypothetical protein [Lachnospiraceae bacterium]
MKKVMAVSLIFATTLMLSACSGGGTASSKITDDTTLMDEVLAERIEEEQGVTEPESPEKAYLEPDEDQIYSSDLIDATFADISEENERQSGVNAGAPEPDEISEDVKLSSTEGIDVDLTELNANMTYSEVYNMMIMPENYLGKTIKMEGIFNSFYDEQADKHYFACIVQDATACCAQGIEFELTDKYTYPDDYPADEETITVVGVFDLYEENNNTYCTLRNAELV